MANETRLSILFTLVACCIEVISNRVSYTAHSPNLDRLLNVDAGSINLTDSNIDRSTHLILKRSLNTRAQTLQLKISTPEIVYKILSPNYKWEHLYDLHFDNNNSQICRSSNHWQFGNRKTSCEVSLPSLVSLTLSNFSDCEVILDKIINCLQMSQLQILKLSSNLNDDFIQQFQEMLRKNYGTLKEIYLSGLMMTRINIFEIRANYTLRNVTAVYLKPRMVEGIAVASNIINDRFCSIFPNLTKLGIKQAGIDFDQLFKLQNCTRLKYLKAVIHLNTSDLERLLVVNWKLKFPYLENIAIKLVFDTCPDPRIFERLITRMSNMKKYILCSNCNLRTKRQMKCTQGSRRTV